jgi:hypothetical protein
VSNKNTGQFRGGVQSARQKALAARAQRRRDTKGLRATLRAAKIALDEGETSRDVTVLVNGKPHKVTVTRKETPPEPTPTPGPRAFEIVNDPPRGAAGAGATKEEVIADLDAVAAILTCPQCKGLGWWIKRDHAPVPLEVDQYRDSRPASSTTRVPCVCKAGMNYLDRLNR